MLDLVPCETVRDIRKAYTTGESSVLARRSERLQIPSHHDYCPQRGPNTPKVTEIGRMGVSYLLVLILYRYITNVERSDDSGKVLARKI